jgi:hypothetical protein
LILFISPQQQTMQTEESREKVRQTEAAQRELRLIKFRTCCLTNEALDVSTPVVCDEIGNLFAKEGLLVALVDKTLPPEYSHIRGLRDVVGLVFHPNPDTPTAGTDVDWSTDNWSPFTCPIANVEMNGRHPFVALRRRNQEGGFATVEGGRVNVISEKALREVGIEALQAEYGPFTVDDVIPLVPGDVERVALIEAMVQRREIEQRAKAHAKAKRKAEKRGAAGAEATEIAATAGGGAAAAADDERGQSTKKKVKSASVPVMGVAKSSSSSQFLGAVMSETAKSLAKAKEGQTGFAALFHGSGSQKPGSATEQFIIQAGKRGILD